MKRIAILGSTGSIGQSALAVVDAHPDRLEVVALAAGENAARFVDQIERYRPSTIAMANEQALADVDAELRRRGAAKPRACGCFPPRRCSSSSSPARPSSPSASSATSSSRC